MLLTMETIKREAKTAIKAIRRAERNKPCLGWGYCYEDENEWREDEETMTEEQMKDLHNQLWDGEEEDEQEEERNPQ